jgi:hypothetical protein
MVRMRNAIVSVDSRNKGFVERMNRTFLHERFGVQDRQKWYTVPPEIQIDLDAFMATT